MSNHIFKNLLKIPSEGDRRILGRMFHRWGATTEKAWFLVVSFWASLRVSAVRRQSWDECMEREDLNNIPSH